MPGRSLRIAWLGPAPGEGGGVPGVANELLHGLTALGHRIDCFFPAAGHQPPAHLAANERLSFVWGTSDWRWDRWYSRTKIGAFASGLLARGLASLRLRREIAARHAREPYDLIYQFSNIENLAAPSSLRHTVPLVVHPETHVAGELRRLLAERRLALRCQPRHTFAIVAAIMFARSLVQRARIRRADLLICISGVFRDHLVNDYGFPVKATVVVPNPVRVERFAAEDQRFGCPPTVLVLGRIAVRKGIDDVVAVARTLLARGIAARIRVVGGPSLWSDYTRLLDDLPVENSEYAGALPAAEIPGELARADVLLQASSYEPFALTVAEGLAAGLPVIATSEVGAIEGVDRSIITEVAPGDIAGIATAIAAILERLDASPVQMRSTARSQAQSLFAPEVVCEQISHALERLLDGRASDIPVPATGSPAPAADAVPAAIAVGARRRVAAP